MTPERFRQIEQLCHSVLEREESQRAAFLEQSCAGDESLLCEVESLLAQQTRGERLEQSPAFEDTQSLAHSAQSLVGRQLGSYRILSLLGAGGMGEVYKAHDARLGRLVAIKRLKAQHRKRFEREARAVAALNHPNICQIHDVGPDYLVLEYIEGKPLRGPLPVAEAVRLALQIASALEEAHRRGILHRDLKPANILVTSKGTAKLLDFGLATFAETRDSASAEIIEGTVGSPAKFAETRNSFAETLEGTVMGTAAYMSPEQAQGKRLDERSDVFSFGAVLYESVSGKRAFDGASTTEVLGAVLKDEPQPLESSAEIVRLVMRCLRKMPAERFQTMGAIRAALEAISDKSAEVQPSIVVLPFANLSRDADDEYFSDGLAEEIINALTQAAGLKVIARTSAFAFKGKNEDIRKIAEALGVTSVLGGSVRRAGNRLRVTSQLIRAADGTHLWSQRYDREMTDIFTVQDEIAAAIVEALQLKLTGKLATRWPHEPNLPAYEAFLRGLQQLDKLSPEAFVPAEGYFKQAISLDPQWADPHSALARDYFYLGMLSLRPLSEMMSLARAEARQAIELLPSEPIAHAVLGAITASHDYAWSEAEEQFRLAGVSGSPPPAVHDIYAQSYLSSLGRFEEAIAHHKKAIAQDPLNVLWRTRLSMTLVHAGIVEGRKALEFDDENRLAHFAIALAYSHQGKLLEARGPAEVAVRQGVWNASATGLLAGLLAKSGEKERAEKLIASMRGGMLPFGMMNYHLACSETDSAMDWVERAVEQRHPHAAQIAAGVYLKPLHSTARWPKLLKMMNLPVE